MTPSTSHSRQTAKLAFCAEMIQKRSPGLDLPREEGCGLLEGLSFLLEPPDALSELAELLALIRCQPVVALAAIELVLFDPVAQRLLRDAKALGDVTDLRPARTSPTASRRNSSGYGGLALGTADILPAAPDGASIQVSTKPGALHGGYALSYGSGMSQVRPLERDDLDEVACLYELVMRSGSTTPAPGLARYIARVLLDQPWADPEMPSLVGLDDLGRIVGFQGCTVLRAVFDGRPVRIGCPGQIVVHPSARHRTIGRQMALTFLAGPQELSMTNSANEPARRLSRAVGGKMVHINCVGWVRVLRPMRWAQIQLRRLRGKRRCSGRGGGVLTTVDTATARLVGALAPPIEPDATCEPLTPAGVVEHLPTVTRRLRLHVDYDERYVEWLLGELAMLTGLGRPIANLVRDPAGVALGWYVYLLQPGGTARVLQVAAPERHIDRVLDHLLHDAWCGGAAAVQGRLEAQLLEPLSRRRCLISYRGGVIAYGGPEILGAVTSGDSLLTRLDSEWWIQDQGVDLAS